jgi:multidrug efflux pump subunit AcrA (membrane-fusion protein)
MTQVAQPGIPRRGSTLTVLPRRQTGRLRLLLPAIVLMVAAIGLAALAQRATEPAPAVPAGPENGLQVRRYPARGQIRPVAYARVGTLTGGVVQELYVDTGAAVQEYQELARVQAGTATEIVRAPFAGTVTNVLVHRGDTLAPGATLVNVGDLSRFQVETNDLDEFLIAEVHRGQMVSVLIDALGWELPGQVRSVSIEPTRSSAGDDHYPVTVDLLESPAELRPGMNVRLRFDVVIPPESPS